MYRYQGNLLLAHYQNQSWEDMANANQLVSHFIDDNKAISFYLVNQLTDCVRWSFNLCMPPLF